jgi:nucleoside-diphosphate-sugar epimerase
MSSGRGKVCVVGANGFIGQHCVSALLEQGHEVRATVRRLGTEPAQWLSKGVQVVEADLASPSSLISCTEGCDVVLNCAGIYKWWVPNTDEYKQVNETGAGHVAQACLKSRVRRLIHFSTPMAYGYPDQKPFNEESKPGLHASEYARTKHLGDLRVKSICEGTDLEVVTLYLGCTIGEGDTMSVGRIAAVIRDFLQGKIPMLVAADTNFIYVHIRDVEAALIAAMKAPSEKVNAEGFFIANSQDMMTTRSFFDLIGTYCGKPPPSMSLNLRIGYWLAQVMTFVSTHITKSEPSAPTDIMRTAQFGSIEYSNQKSIDILGLSYTPIEVAVAESVADVKRRMAKEEAPRFSKVGKSLAACCIAGVCMWLVWTALA